jgi:hypothetical protein
MHRFLTLLALAITQVFAQAPASFVPDKPPFSVRLSIVVDADPVIQSHLANCLTRELRSVPGVIVTAQDPDVSVNVIAQGMSSGGTRFGFALAAMVYQVEQRPWHGLYQAPDVPALCKMAAADIERQAVEAARQGWQGRRDLTPDAILASHQ